MAISLPSWQKRFPTVSTNMLRKPTASIIPPKIFDVTDHLGSAGDDHSISRRYYFSDIPCWHCGDRSTFPSVRQLRSSFADCDAGTLPRVSFVEPRFLGEGQGISGDDHPFSDIRNGEAFLNLGLRGHYA